MFAENFDAHATLSPAIAANSTIEAPGMTFLSIPTPPDQGIHWTRKRMGVVDARPALDLEPYGVGVLWPASVVAGAAGAEDSDRIGGLAVCEESCESRDFRIRSNNATDG